jgi:hypothetical protein
MENTRLFLSRHPSVFVVQNKERERERKEKEEERKWERVNETREMKNQGAESFPFFNSRSLANALLSPSLPDPPLFFPFRGQERNWGEKARKRPTPAVVVFVVFLPNSRVGKGRKDVFFFVMWGEKPCNFSVCGARLARKAWTRERRARGWDGASEAESGSGSTRAGRELLRDVLEFRRTAAAFSRKRAAPTLRCLDF